MTQTISPQSTRAALFIALELSISSWKLGISTGGRVRIRTVDAGDVHALLNEIGHAREGAGVDAGDVMICFEAGRDGFWLQRLLASQGLACVVVDPSSIQMDRRARQRKTDRIDATKLCTQLARWVAGDDDALRVVVIPSEAEEDARRRERELSCLKKERARHSARIKGLLALHGVLLTSKYRVGSTLDLSELKQWNGEPFPTELVGEVERELKRLEVTEEQIKVLEKARTAELKRRQSKEANRVTALTALRGVGPGSAWTLILEAFGWREFANRRQLASYAGLDPTPFASGDTDEQRGISKAGNKRIRTMMIELAWSWLQFQPNSALAKWFNARFAKGKRVRRIGIVALARKLLIALWRFLKDGVVPEGALLKP